MDCDSVRASLAEYALDALPADVQREVRAHVSECDAHGEAVGLRAAALTVAAAAPERAPPPALRDRLLAAIEREAIGQPPARRPAPRVARGLRHPRFRPNLAAVAAALALLAAGLGGWNIALQVSDGGDAVGAIVRPFSGEAGGSGRVLLLEAEGLAVLELTGLPPLPAGRIYQIWALDDGRAVGAGTFSVDTAGGAVVVIRVDRTSTDTIAVTEEPLGGSLQPTTPVLLSAAL